MRNLKDNKYLIIGIIVASLISIGIAFATFATNLTIGGSASVEASNWEIVFEGLTTYNVLDNPVTTGLATEVTHPTIKNNATEISTYSVTLQAPGDSVTYNFKIHNKGDFSASVSGLTIAGVSNPTTAITGSALVTDSTIATNNANTLSEIEYKFYYTDNNVLVGQDEEKDCLAPGEEENVTLRIVFSNVDETDTSVLPSSNLVLDNLGLTLTYEQGESCTPDSGGGGGSGETDAIVPGSVDEPITNGTGESITPPTVSNNEIDDAEVSFTNNGDSITYPIDLTSNENVIINSISIPSLPDLIGENPNIDPDILENIEISVVDADTGEPITITNTKCLVKDTTVRIKMVLKYKDVPTKDVLKSTTSVKIPKTTISYKKTYECTNYNVSIQSFNNKGEYLIGEYEDGSMYSEDMTTKFLFTSNKNELYHESGTHPTEFIKKVNDTWYVCFERDSNEYCIDYYANADKQRDFCTILGGTYGHYHYYSSTGNEGSSCRFGTYGTMYFNIDYEPAKDIDGTHYDEEFYEAENGIYLTGTDGGQCILNHWLIQDGYDKHYCTYGIQTCRKTINGRSFTFGYYLGNDRSEEALTNFCQTIQQQ